MKTKRILAAIAFALLAAVMAFIYVRFAEKPIAGSKSVTLEVSVVRFQNYSYQDILMVRIFGL